MTTELDAMQRFWDLWDRDFGRVRCVETGAWIEFHPNCCAHLWSKGSNIRYRKQYLNMIPLSYEMHMKMDNQSKKSMHVWPILDEMVMILKWFYHNPGEVYGMRPRVRALHEYRVLLSKAFMLSSDEIRLELSFINY